jgi:phosphoenolpyruvate carboxylase
MLPGWYGFGSAVKAWLAAHPNRGMTMLQSMYREWPFFQMLLSNMDMVLAKSDIAIASASTFGAGGRSSNRITVTDVLRTQRPPGRPR